MFALEGIGEGLTFKGGTSLSKGWKLIHRFSEDIDVVISRALLGFSGDGAPDAPNISGKERDKRLDDLAVQCQRFVADKVLPALAARLPEGATRSARAALELDPLDPEQQTILFHYPGEFGALAYVRPVVKIELGARSDVDPVETPELSPYLAAVLPAIVPFKVATVSPTRTFWEKAMLLHEENGRKEPGKPKDRLSRHYYDLWCLIANGVAATASIDLGLFEAVANHRRVYFRKSRAAQDSLRRG
ncbi:MAG TPA: nucleotidyl transferase AbiEii/AbiGii toxin family protein, partial [Planctomycetota bacterium]|nr:nucleotidyl transferase AbiEii/AbiGii toxin family protein [Planctomycetota bacterium]